MQSCRGSEIVPVEAHRRVAWRMRFAPAIAFDPAEHGWHRTRLPSVVEGGDDDDDPPVGFHFTMLALALSHPRTWGVLAQALPWLGRHGLRTDVRWRVWFYFVTRYPMRYIMKPRLSITFQHAAFGFLHGLVVTKDLHYHLRSLDDDFRREDRAIIKAKVMDPEIESRSFAVSLYFAGKRARCGEFPNEIRVHYGRHTARDPRDPFYQHGTNQHIFIGWQPDGRIENVEFWRDLDPRSCCVSCNGLRLMDIRITYGTRVSWPRTYRLTDACPTCKWACANVRDWRTREIMRQGVVYERYVGFIPEILRNYETTSLRHVVAAFEDFMRSDNPTAQILEWPRLKAGRRPAPASGPRRAAKRKAAPPKASGKKRRSARRAAPAASDTESTDSDASSSGSE